MTSHAILISASPSDKAHIEAYQFCLSTLQQQGRIDCIFFYQDGVYVASNLVVLDQDEFDIHQAWQNLSTEYQIPLQLCVGSSLRRGMLDTDEAKRHDRKYSNVAPPFVISGLGTWIEASIHADIAKQF